MTIDGNENIDIKPSDGKVKSNDDKKNTDGTTDGSGDNKGENQPDVKNNPEIMRKINHQEENQAKEIQQIQC